MSYRKEKIWTLAEGAQKLMSAEKPKSKVDLKSLFQSTMERGMHGICFSAYEEGQSPGHILEEKQVRRRIEILKPYSKWVRSFSCVEGNEWIPKIAKENGMKTLVGAWLGNDLDMNKKEIEGLIELAKAGYVDIAAVGNEVLYRGDLTEAQLLAYIHQVKKELPAIEVGYVDAYYEFSDHPAITEACDVVLANCYPYWEGCHFDHSIAYMKQMYQQAIHSAKGKKVIITETGWPSQGGNLKAAHPNWENSVQYFIRTQQWSAKDNIDIFYFSSFDESWKIAGEGDVGAYWGLWDKNEVFKF